jgi:hypothetical protein
MVEDPRLVACDESDSMVIPEEPLKSAVAEVASVARIVSAVPAPAAVAVPLISPLVGIVRPVGSVPTGTVHV